MKKRILIITTGGTIAMRYDSEKGLVPAHDLTEFLRSFPQLNAVAEIDTLEFTDLPSPYITPETAFRLAKLADLKSVDYDGIVITHGTDTLEESAYLLDLVCTTRKPIVFTAAMRSGSDLGLDGPRNIVGAVRAASDPLSADKGVLVVMNDEILAARDVVKTDTGRVQSFYSMDYGILGIIDSDRIVYYRETVRREHIWSDKLEPNIDLIKAATGMDGRFIEASVNHGARAIVIEAFGRGNLPPDLIPHLQAAIERKILVVIVSRAYTGRVLPEYGYDGGGLHLERIGCILGGDLKGNKARIKLMALFGRYDDPDLVRKFFIEGLD
jgi:L-asparaginase